MSWCDPDSGWENGRRDVRDPLWAPHREWPWLVTAVRSFLGTPRVRNFPMCAWGTRSGFCCPSPHLPLSDGHGNLVRPGQASRLASILNSYASPRTTFHSFLDAFRASASSDPHGIPEKATLLLQREGVNQIFRAMWLRRKNACRGAEGRARGQIPAFRLRRCLLCNPEKAGPLLRAVVLSSVKWDDDGACLTGRLWILSEQSLAHVNILLPVGYLEDLQR